MQRRTRQGIFERVATLAAVLTCAAGLAGCGGKVVVEDDEASDPISGAGAAGGGGAAGSLDDCQLCFNDCGLCEYEGGEFAFQCRGDDRPQDPSIECMQTGSIYSDAEGPYVCYRCFMLDTDG